MVNCVTMGWTSTKLRSKECASRKATRSGLSSSSISLINSMSTKTGIRLM